MPTSIISKIKDLMFYLVFIVIGLGLGLGLKWVYGWYQQPPILVHSETSAHFENTVQKVVIYTTEWCPYCAKVRDYLIENNIAYDERDITIGNPKTDSLYDSLGHPGVPKIIIGNTIINGAYMQELEQELKKANLL